MTLEIDWRSIQRLPADRLKEEIFNVLAETAEYLQSAQPDHPSLLSVVPQLADAINENEVLHSFREVYSTLARSVGLWNYIDKRDADSRDRYVAEAATIPELG